MNNVNVRSHQFYVIAQYKIYIVEPKDKSTFYFCYISIRMYEPLSHICADSNQFITQARFR